MQGDGRIQCDLFYAIQIEEVPIDVGSYEKNIYSHKWYHKHFWMTIFRFIMFTMIEP